MAGFRLLDQDPQHRLANGDIASGGELRFYENNSTTPKNVFNGADLSPSLGAIVVLGADGRPESNKDIWLDGVYRVRLYDGPDPTGALVWSKDDVQDGSTGGLVPLDPADGTEGQAYLTDGLDGYWGDILAVPDPTGHSGKYLGNDGTDPAWTAFPAAVTYDETTLPGGITQGATSVQIGKMKWQYGSGTVAASGALTANVAVTFAEAYTTLLHVNVTLTGSGGSTPQGAKPSHSYVGTLTGFTLYLYANDEHDTPGWLLTAGTSFTYEAIGLVA